MQSEIHMFVEQIYLESDGLRAWDKYGVNKVIPVLTGEKIPSLTDNWAQRPRIY
jgi:hypothetical protein